MASRNPNFTPFERRVLLDNIKLFKEIIEDKRTDKITTKEKEKAWAEVTKRYNSHEDVHPRICKQLEYCWKNLKNKYNSQRLAVLQAVDGGSSVPHERKTHRLTVEEILQRELTSVQTALDRKALPDSEDKLLLSVGDILHKETSAADQVLYADIGDTENRLSRTLSHSESVETDDGETVVKVERVDSDSEEDQSAVKTAKEDVVKDDTHEDTFLDRSYDTGSPNVASLSCDMRGAPKTAAASYQSLSMTSQLVASSALPYRNRPPSNPVKYKNTNLVPKSNKSKQRKISSECDMKTDTDSDYSSKEHLQKMRNLKMEQRFMILRQKREVEEHKKKMELLNLKILNEKERRVANSTMK